MKSITQLLIPFLLLVFLQHQANGQDIIYPVNGTEIKAKVLEVTPEVVKYKKFDFQDGPTYSMNKLEIIKIKYQNGMEDIFIPEQDTLVKDSISNPEPIPNLEPEQKADTLSNDATVIIASEIPEDTFPEKPKTETNIYPNEKLLELKEKKDSRLGFYFGGTIGINGATGWYNYNEGPDPSPWSILLTPTVGFHMDWRITKIFSLQSHLWYRGKGDRIDMADYVSRINLPTTPYPIDFQIEAKGDIRTYIGYFEMTLLPVFNLGKYFQIGAGAYGAIGLHGKEKYDYSFSYYVDGRIDDIDEQKGERTIEFSTILATGTDDENTRYINQLDYGYLGYLGFCKKTYTIGLLGSWGQELWEPQNEFLSSGKTATETQHLTTTLFWTWFF